MNSNIFTIIVAVLTVLMLQNGFAQEKMTCSNDRNQFTMFQKLNLTEAQQEQIVYLRLNHQMEIVDLKANLQKKKLELVELKYTNSYTKEAYIDYVGEICSAKNNIAISIANFQMDVNQLLDDNQKKEWNKYSFNFDERKEKRVKRKMRETQID